MQEIYPEWWGDGSDGGVANAAPHGNARRLVSGTELQQMRLEDVVSQCISTPLANAEPAELEAAAAALRAVAEKRRRNLNPGRFNPKACKHTITDALAASMGGPALRHSLPCQEVPQKAAASSQLPARHDSHSPAFLTSTERLGDISEFSKDRVARQGLRAPRMRPQKWRVVSKVGLQLAEQKYQAERRAEKRAEQLRTDFVRRYGIRPLHLSN